MQIQRPTETKAKFYTIAEQIDMLKAKGLDIKQNSHGIGKRR